MERAARGMKFQSALTLVTTFFCALWACPGSVLCQTCSTPVRSSSDAKSPRSLEISVPWNKECLLVKLYVAIYSTDVNSPDFCTLATSALSFGYELNVLGPVHSSERQESGSVDQFWELQQFTKSVPDEPATLILFVGSAHTLFTSSPEALVIGFLTVGKDVLFPASKRCCHEWWKSVEALRKQEPLRCDERCVYVGEGRGSGVYLCLCVFVCACAYLSAEAHAHARVCSFVSVSGCACICECVHSGIAAVRRHRWPAPAEATATPYVDGGVLVGRRGGLLALLAEASLEYRSTAKVGTLLCLAACLWL